MPRIPSWFCLATTATEVPDSLGVFELIMDLQKRYGDRVVALRGNHEEMFLEYIDEVKDPNFTQAWILADSNLATAKSFLDAEAFKHVKRLLRLREFEEAYAFTVERIKAEHADIIAWIRKLPYFYESPFGQVFVHAGVDEEAGEYWKLGTSAESFTMMMPDYVGHEFYLDVIAGHINTETVSGIAGYRGIWHDGASHYYIDGNVMKNGEVARAELRLGNREVQRTGAGVGWRAIICRLIYAVLLQAIRSLL